MNCSRVSPRECQTPSLRFMVASFARLLFHLPSRGANWGATDDSRPRWRLRLRFSRATSRRAAAGRVDFHTNTSDASIFSGLIFECSSSTVTLWAGSHSFLGLNKIKRNAIACLQRLVYPCASGDAGRCCIEGRCRAAGRNEGAWLERQWKCPFRNAALVETTVPCVSNYFGLMRIR